MGGVIIHKPSMYFAWSNLLPQVEMYTQNERTLSLLDYVGFTEEGPRRG